MKVKVLSVSLIGAVPGGIVEDDHKVICIILSKNRVEIILYPRLHIIVQGAHDETEGQFLLVFIEMINLIQSLILFLFIDFLLLVHRVIIFQAVLYQL